MTKFSIPRFFITVFLCAFGLLSFSANAADVTPSHVFQVVDNINNELTLLHEANHSTATVSARKMTQRRPRHVFQKAREVLLNVQNLRKLNGLSFNPVPPFPTTEITPGNVRKIMDQILADLKGLRPVLGVKKTATAAPLPSGKNPTDVYINIDNAGQSISSLGIPAIVPNDVYRMVATLVNEMRLVVKAAGGDATIAMKDGSKRKKPKHVYSEVYGLLEDLKAACAKKSSYCLPGKLVLPTKPTGRIKPAEVLDVVNNALADVGALKVVLGVKTPTQLVDPVSGKTPSNVYDGVLTARALAASL